MADKFVRAFSESAAAAAGAASSSENFCGCSKIEISIADHVLRTYSGSAAAGRYTVYLRKLPQLDAF